MPSAEKMKISELPLVASLAQWVWSVDDDTDVATNHTTTISPERCLAHVDALQLHDFVFTSGCFAHCVTKGSGVAIIVGACFNKAPTMLNMIQAQSAEGFSPMALYMEVLFYVNSSLYSIQHRHPVTAVCT